ncbi:MAG: hypothetical protein ACLQNE_37665, partial [Thermoguttaceae bacterium]
SRRRPSAPAGPWRGRALHSNYYPHARSSSLPPPKAYIAFGSPRRSGPAFARQFVGLQCLGWQEPIAPS